MLLGGEGEGCLWTLWLPRPLFRIKLGGFALHMLLCLPLVRKRETMRVTMTCHAVQSNGVQSSGVQ